MKGLGTRKRRVWNIRLKRKHSTWFRSGRFSSIHSIFLLLTQLSLGTPASCISAKQTEAKSPHTLTAGPPRVRKETSALPPCARLGSATPSELLLIPRGLGNQLPFPTKIPISKPDTVQTRRRAPQLYLWVKPRPGPQPHGEGRPVSGRTRLKCPLVLQGSREHHRKPEWRVLIPAATALTRQRAPRAPGFPVTRARPFLRCETRHFSFS